MGFDLKASVGYLLVPGEEMMRRVKLVRSLVVALVMIPVACGGESEPSATLTPTEMPAVEPTAEPTEAPTPTPAPTPVPTPEPTEAPAQANCHPSYPDVCIPPAPPDLNCGDISHRRFTVRHDVADPDPHGFDRDKDGVGCES